MMFIIIMLFIIIMMFIIIMLFIIIVVCALQDGSDETEVQEVM